MDMVGALIVFVAVGFPFIALVLSIAALMRAAKLKARIDELSAAAARK